VISLKAFSLSELDQMLNRHFVKVGRAFVKEFAVSQPIHKTPNLKHGVDGTNYSFIPAQAKKST